MDYVFRQAGGSGRVDAVYGSITHHPPTHYISCQSIDSVSFNYKSAPTDDSDRQATKDGRHRCRSRNNPSDVTTDVTCSRKNHALVRRCALFNSRFGGSDTSQSRVCIITECVPVLTSLPRLSDVIFSITRYNSALAGKRM